METEPWVLEIENLIKARCPLISVTSCEETRITRVLDSLAQRLGQGFRYWSRTRGFCFVHGRADTAAKDPMEALKFIEEFKEPMIFLIRDFHPFLKDPTVVRLLRDLNADLKMSHKTIVFLGPIPLNCPDIARDLMNVEVPLPDAETIAVIVRGVLQSLKRSTEGIDMESIVSASLGLSQDEIENVIARSLVRSGEIDVRTIFNEKKAIVKKSGIMDFIDLRGDLQGVGGIDVLKDWLSKRKDGFSNEAKSLGLPTPKGILLVGIPGCGKSLTARATAGAWNLPLIRLDVGRVFGGLVGSSEANMRQAIATAEAVSPCILWIDEVEKAFAGVKGGGGGDSGTSVRVFGTFLTWMQEKEKPVFVVATANDVAALPPEFLRKGRFDELFFVDLPTTSERKDILDIQVKRYGWPIDPLPLDTFAEDSVGFSGAEIEQALISARYEAFFHKRELSFEDLRTALKKTVPLSTTMRTDIEHLRVWAKTKAVMASSPETEATTSVNPRPRALSLEA